jgi:hypothetical protein
MIQSGVSQIALVDVPAIEKYWMAFRKEEFIEPNAGESEEEFLGRCIPAMIDEGREQDQAVAMCYSMYQNMSYDTSALPVYTDEIPEKKQKFAETYTDYPEAAVENAKRALAYAEENGWGDCGMGAGKARANQLANREAISEDTIARMSSFERHRQNSKTPYGEGCGKLMWDAWGGSEGIEWAARKLKQIREEKFASSELDVYGYPTRFFYMCPGATETFRHLMEMGPHDEDVIGMIRSAALQADRVFEIEAEVIEAESADVNQLKEAIILVDDFKSLMHEIDEEVGMTHDVSYMDGHLIKINEYLETPIVMAEERPIARIPKEERGREGSEKNKPGDTTTSRGGIEVTEEVEKTLKDKIEEHNKKNPQDSQKADLGMLKAVWRRGAGAYSVGTPGRKGMTRPQWSMGRVNAFLKILSGSSPSDKDYTQDNDLLPKGHPKHSEQKMSKFLFASEDQQILVGPVAVPDMEIVRKDKKTKEIYYVRFSKEVVQRMAEKFMKELRNDQTNIDHNPEDKAGSYIMETWVVENEQDKANSVYNLDVPIGTWVVKMRVTDPETWKMVKNGELRGFSLEGNFLDREDWEAYQRDREIYNKVIKILKSS